MKEKKECLEEKVATRVHITTDMGTGSSYCSNCNYDFGSQASKIYEKCPKCNYRIIEGAVTPYPFGGSDF